MNLFFKLNCNIVAMIIAKTINIRFINNAFSGNNENMKNASSPVVVMSAAIKAGKFTTL
jgi:hypothetical protein